MFAFIFFIFIKYMLNVEYFVNHTNHLGKKYLVTLDQLQ